MDNSKIEWTDATWNVIRGCEKVSPGCAHCYAETLVNGRLRGDFSKLQVLADKIDQPLRWRRPRRIFVNSLSDLFWDQVPTDVVDRHFAVMALAPQHTFQILTKRPDRMRAYLTEDDVIERIINRMDDFSGQKAIAFAMRSDIDLGDGRKIARRWPLPNVWLGTSTENQAMFDRRVDDLRLTPAAVRFLSIEPLLGPIDTGKALRREARVCSSPTCDHAIRGCHNITTFPGIDWVIVGGESGMKARPMNPGWVRRLRDQCVAAGVPFFFKQWGEWAPAGDVGLGVDSGRFYPVHNWTDLSASLRFGKKLAGRRLDGRLWDEVPKGR